MMISGFRLYALILILLGVVGLLGNFGVLDLDIGDALRTYWPIILVYFGLRPFLSGRYRHHTWYLKSALLVALGMFLLAVNLEWIEVTIRSVWGVVWPVVLIWIGLEAFNGRHRTFIVHGETDLSKAPRVMRNGSMKVVSAFVGDLRVGGKPFELEDTHYDIRLGDVQIDLTQALIPDREVRMEVVGLAGDVKIYVPHDLPVKVEARVALGEIDVFGDHSGTGVGGPAYYKSPGYDEATRKLNLFIDLKAGDIGVRRI